MTATRHIAAKPDAAARPDDATCREVAAMRSRADLAVFDGWVLQDADGVVVHAEMQGDTLFGWPAGELLGGAAVSLVHPDDRDIATKVRMRVRNEGGAQSLQIRLRARNGRWLWVEVLISASPIVDGRGGGLTCAAMRDVSARYIGNEAMSILIDLRQVIASARTIAAAWQFGLERIGQLGSFDEAVVWGRRAEGFGATHEWRSEQEGSAAPSSSSSSAEREIVLRRHLDSVWRNGAPVWVAEELLVPALSAGRVVAVVELRGRRPENDGAVELSLITEVVGQLGDAMRRKQADTELGLARQRFELAFSEASIGMALVGLDGSFIDANDALCKLLERSHDGLRSIGFLAVTHPDDVEIDLSFVNQVLAGEINTYQLEKRYLRPGGEVVWGLLSVSLVRDGDGAPVHFISQIQDITAQKLAERQVKRSMARFRAAFDDSALGMALVAVGDGQDGVIVEANDEMQRIFSERGGDLAGIEVEDLVDPGPDATFFESMLALSSVDSAVRAEMPAKRADGDERWIRLVAAPVRDDADAGRFVVLQVEDITEERRIQAEISHLALHDALTGLPNRVLMLDRVHRAQERSDRSHRHIGLLFIDLDNFKEVNDTYGHSYGDELLKEVANRFRAVLRPNDSAARLGGDEFVIMCEELSEDRVVAEQELATISCRLHAQLSAPAVIEGSEFLLSASVGSHVSLGSRESVQAIMSNADAAMYQAKALGRSRTEVYDAAVRGRAADRIAMANDLRAALADGDLRVFYQPIVDLDGYTPVAAEALLRWTHHERGPVSPADFIDVAEESELIVDVGQFVFDQVCADLAGPNAPQGYVSVNVSARQLSQADFVSRITTCLDTWKIDPSRIAIELTESVLVEASGSSHRQLGELRDLGLRIGVDDFGTGYATLRYVKDLPVTFLKIDRSFVSGLTTDHGDLMISKAVIGLADALGLDTIAEGVETAEQVRILTELGCPHAQGYWFGHPAPLVP